MPNMVYNENTDTIEIENTGIGQAKIDRAYHVVELAIDGKLLLDIANLHTLNQVYVKGSSAYTSMARRIINTRSRLRRALDLLIDIGDIVSYTLRADGRLNINWFDTNTVPDITPIVPRHTNAEIDDICNDANLLPLTGLRQWFNYFPNVDIQHKHNWYRDDREAWYHYRRGYAMPTKIYSPEKYTAKVYGEVKHSPKPPIKVVHHKKWLDTVDAEALYSRVHSKPNMTDESKRIAEDF